MAILSHTIKIIEKARKNKFESLNSQVLDSREYQTGFKKNSSTHVNLAKVINEILRTRKKPSERKVYTAINLRKAYESVIREKLFKFLRERAKTEEEGHLINLIEELYSGQSLQIGDQKIFPMKGVM